jgi:hypothetical protein
MTRYTLILEQSRIIDDVLFPAGAVMNIILWDGAATYEIEEGYQLIPSETLSTGEMYP